MGPMARKLIQLHVDKLDKSDEKERSLPAADIEVLLAMLSSNDGYVGNSEDSETLMSGVGICLSRPL